MHPILLILLSAAAPSRAADLRITAYATAGNVQRYLAPAEARERTVAALRSLGVTRVVLEGRRGDEYASPALLGELRSWLARQGIESSGGIATVPGRSFAVRQQGPLSWLNWEAPATREAIAGFFRDNAPVFDELVVDDFYCTADTSPESETARAGRDWGEYRRDLLTGLIRPLIVDPARSASPTVRLILKFPQWYDRFHLFGYDPARMPAFFDRIWAGTEVRNPKTKRMGYVQPTQGYINYRWLSDVAGGKVDAAWFDHIECTAQNFADQAWQSVLAGARELVLFNLGDIAAGHEGHELFRKALPALRETAARIAGRAPEGVAYYKPPGSDPGENRFLPDYLAMLGIPLVPCGRYPQSARSVILGVPAAHDAGLLDKVRQHQRRGARVVMTRDLVAKIGPVKGAVTLDLRTFTEQDYLDAGEWLLPPKELDWVDMPRERADALRRSVGVDLSAPAGIACYRFGGASFLYSFRDEDVTVKAASKTAKVPAHGQVWIH